MAKAKPDFTSFLAAAPPPRSRSPNRAKRTPPRSRPCRRSSPALLALLATIHASPESVNGYPLDQPKTSLPFLYPPFLVQPTPSLIKRSATSSTSSAASTSTSSSGCHLDRANLPDKYVLGDDGYWHKTLPWSLYGSTSCSNPCYHPSPVPDMVNNDHNDSEGAESTTKPTTSPDDFDISTLPTGWTSINIDSTTRRDTLVAVSLSVALTVIIIVLMFACVFWRRKMAPKRDPEKKCRMSSAVADNGGSSSIREAKAAQRKWTRAAFRWRDNIRLSARRRRTNQALASSMSYTTLAQDKREANIETESSPSNSQPSSPTLTPRSITPTHPDVHTSSMASIRSSHSQIQLPQVLTSQALPTDSAPSSPTHPPAYHPQASLPSSPPPLDVSPQYTYSDSGPSGTSKAPLSFPTQSQPHGNDDSHLSSLSGHVATDDKATLSLRTALASAPLEPGSHFPQSVSVPSMEDEEMFEMPSESRPSSPSPDGYVYEPHPPYSPPTSRLPPPPTKGKHRFDYSYDLDISMTSDTATVEPQLGPSAPPFEESEAVPSAPPLDLDVPVPSAPPMDPGDCPDSTLDGPDGADA
ncbi:hypothetical protein BJV74DRAFT_489569 [Russula compacta]|nr:hypothetical protein BJV74DRAFT_489569 [Russula compacta]